MDIEFNIFVERVFFFLHICMQLRACCRILSLYLTILLKKLNSMLPTDA